MMKPNVISISSKINALPTVKTFAQLKQSEQTVVTAIRLWAQLYRNGKDGLATAVDHFAYHNAAIAGYYLDTILHLIAVSTMQHVVDVRCLKCPHLSPDEARFLEAIAAFQHGKTDVSQTSLSSGLPRTAKRCMAQPMRSLAFALIEGKLYLPKRKWDFMISEQSQASPPAI